MERHGPHRDSSGHEYRVSVPRQPAEYEEPDEGLTVACVRLCGSRMTPEQHGSRVTWTCACGYTLET